MAPIASITRRVALMAGALALAGCAGLGGKPAGT
ncbi:molybdenum ABC transporter substrate-binding protein, partial [Halomonas sp. ND22Bw]